MQSVWLNPTTDVEMIAMAAQFSKDIGITNVGGA